MCQNQSKNFIYLIYLHNIFSSYLTLMLLKNQWSGEEGVWIKRKPFQAADTAVAASGTPSGLWNRCSLGEHFLLYRAIINQTSYHFKYSITRKWSHSYLFKGFIALHKYILRRTFCVCVCVCVHVCVLSICGLHDSEHLHYKVIYKRKLL